MLMAAAFLLGTIGYRSMRLELNPEVNFGVVTVNTIYPGAGPEEINTLVTRKIEDAVSGVAGLREVTGASQEGFSTVVATFELEVDVNEALNDVRSRVDGILNELPDDVQKPQITKFDNSAQPVLYLSMSSQALSFQKLRDLVDDKLQDRFRPDPRRRLGRAVQGGDVREIQVRLDKDKLLAYGVGAGTLQRQIQAATLNMPAGTGDLRRSASSRCACRKSSRRWTRSAICGSRSAIRTARWPRRGSVVLSDVAEVVDSTQERTTYSRLNGQDTIVLAILKAREGNAVQIGHAADRVITDIKRDYASAGIEVVKTFEQGEQIAESLADLNFTLFFAVVLVAAIVWIFLHSLRGTIIVALAIPTSIFATFAVLSVLGFTINNMTMLALILAVGVLVDDAIVVLENIFRHLKMGEDPRDAALNGRGEIGLAAMAITLADVVVFLRSPSWAASSASSSAPWRGPTSRRSSSPSSCPSPSRRCSLRAGSGAARTWRRRTAGSRSASSACSPLWSAATAGPWSGR
jgi:HAE1 family hydrophobic/amphiphilic exporter-1